MPRSIVVCGRVFTDEILQHVHQLCTQEPAPSGNAVAREVCAQLDWCSPNGRWATSSCKVALRKLHRRGLIPWPGRRHGVRGPRRLRRSGQPLPRLASPLPARVDQLAGLRLHLITDSHDPRSAVWNDLICAQHPCGDAPLVGAQLRYLIDSDHGCLGALGFGPAAWLLGPRDLWIGWSSAARKHHLPQVVGLARLLIRLEVRCQNLATKVLALVLARLPADWASRYGVRPLLVETFVDRAHFHGGTFLAANWQRLGQSQGRGRLGPATPQKSRKDIYVFPLHPRARQHLQTEPARPVVPRPLHESAAAGAWWEEEMAGLDLGDVRLARRATQILAARAGRPGASFFGSFDDPHQSKRAYALLSHPNPALNLAALLAPHAEATLARMATAPVVLLPQDTCELNYSGLRQTAGLGPLNYAGTRGLFLHGLLAWQPDGVPLGVLHAHTWARPEAVATAAGRDRNQRSIDEKESRCWLEALGAAQRSAQRLPHTTLVTLADRGGDLYELYDLVQAGAPNLHAIVRAQHDRNLVSHQKLWAFMAAQSLGRRTTLAVPRHAGRPARTATLEVRWAEVTIAPPAVHAKKTWPPLRLWAVWACEPNPPAGLEPVEWMLLTDLPVANWTQAREKLQWYCRRWGNEEWHRVLKTGCGVERRESETAANLERAVAFELILAWRVLLLVKLGRALPDLPATTLFTAEELAVLGRSKKKRVRAAPDPDLAASGAAGRGLGWLAGGSE